MTPPPQPRRLAPMIPRGICPARPVAPPRCPAPTPHNAPPAPPPHRAPGTPGAGHARAGRRLQGGGPEFPQRLERGCEVVRTAPRTGEVGEVVADPVREAEHAGQHLVEPAQLGAEPEEEQAVLPDR